MDEPVGSAILRKSSIIDEHYKSTINAKGDRHGHRILRQM